MASMNMNNNWLGFSLSPHQEIPSRSQDHLHHHHHHHQHNNSQSTTTTTSSTTVVPRLGFINSEELISSAAAEDQCFDHLITSDDSTLIPSLNLPAPFSILEAFNRTNQSHDWDVKDVNIMNTVVVGETLVNQEPPKLENFLGQPSNNTTIGLSMIKNWLRNNPSSTATTQPSTTGNNFENNNNVVNVDTNIGTFLPTSSTTSNNNISTAQNLSLSMSTGSDIGDGGGGGGGGSGGGESYSTSDTKQSSSCSGMETVPRKSIDTFGQRTSIYRGVTRHRWTGRYEAHLWDNSCRREGQTRKGRQVYLGGYDKEEKAARAYDLAALKYWGTTTTTNFPISNYEKELEEMKHMTRQEYVASLRRKSSGFSRGASIYRGVTRHHQHGRWQARIGRVAGNKDLYLGTFSTQEEAAEAYDIAAIKFRGLNAVTNFEISRYDVKSILESSTLPIGGAAKRLKDAQEMVAEAQRTTTATNIIDQRHHDNNNLLLVGSHLTDGVGCNVNYGWPSSLAFHQQSAGHPFHHYPNYTTQQHQRVIWCKQEQDNSDDHHHHGSFQDTHNFLLQQQPPSGSGGSGSSSVLHNLMSLDSSSLDHNSGSNSNTNSVIYSINGYGNNIGGGGFHLPIGNQSQSQDQNQNGFLDHHQDEDREVKEQQHEMGYGNLYYYQQQHQQQQLSATMNNNNNWVASGMPTTRSSINVAVCHGPASTFTVWNE